MKVTTNTYYCCVIFCIGILSIAIVILLSAGFIIGSERGTDNHLSQDLLLSCGVVFAGLSSGVIIAMICSHVCIMPKETGTDPTKVVTITHDIVIQS